MTKEKDKELLKICPGRGYDIVDLGKRGLQKLAMITNWVITKASVQLDLMILKLIDKSTSGAMMPNVANYLLEKKYVEGILL